MHKYTANRFLCKQFTQNNVFIVYVSIFCILYCIRLFLFAFSQPRTKIKRSKLNKNKIKKIFV